jgi:hypothetical protein
MQLDLQNLSSKVPCASLVYVFFSLVLGTDATDDRKEVSRYKKEIYVTPPALLRDNPQAMATFFAEIVKDFPIKLVLDKQRVTWPFGYNREPTTPDTVEVYLKIDVLLALEPSKGFLVLSCIKNETTNHCRYLLRPAAAQSDPILGQISVDLGKPVVGIEVPLSIALEIQSGKVKVPWDRIQRIARKAKWTVIPDSVSKDGLQRSFKFRPPVIEQWE